MPVIFFHRARAKHRVYSANTHRCVKPKIIFVTIIIIIDGLFIQTYCNTAAKKPKCSLQNIPFPSIESLRYQLLPCQKDLGSNPT